MWAHCDIKIQIPHFLLLTQKNSREKHLPTTSFEYAHNLYASTLVFLSPCEVQKVILGRVQAFYEWYYLYIKDLQFCS